MGGCLTHELQVEFTTHAGSSGFLPNRAVAFFATVACHSGFLRANTLRNHLEIVSPGALFPNRKERNEMT